jgi:hypothetical protein
MKQNNTAQNHTNSNLDAITTVCDAIRHSLVHHPASILVRILSYPYPYPPYAYTHKTADTKNTVIGENEWKKREPADGQKPQLASNLYGIPAATSAKMAQGAANVTLKLPESDREGRPPPNAFVCFEIRWRCTCKGGMASNMTESNPGQSLRVTGG